MADFVTDFVTDCVTNFCISSRWGNRLVGHMLYCPCIRDKCNPCKLNALLINQHMMHEQNKAFYSFGVYVLGGIMS